MPLIINGFEIDLTHLEDHTFDSAILLPPSISKTVNILVRFSTHCYSRSREVGEIINFDELVSDDSSRLRIFDEVRYDLSKSLPGLMYGLLRNDCYIHRLERNFGYCVRPSPEAGWEYWIYFEAQKKQLDSGFLIELYVESAYRKPIGTEKGLGKQNRLRVRKALGRVWAGQRV